MKAKLLLKQTLHHAFFILQINFVQLTRLVNEDMSCRGQGRDQVFWKKWSSGNWKQ